MIKLIQRYFGLPERTSYEGRLRNRTLNTILWGIVLTSLILGLDHLYFHARQTADLLFALSFLCLLGLQINERGHYILTSLIASLIILVATFYNSLEGEGIHDPAVLAYPMIILIGGLLFGKRASLILFLASAASLISVGALQIGGYIHTPYGADVGDLVAQVVLIGALTYLVWVIMENVENSLKRATQSEDQLKESYDMTLEGWAKALEFRDRETEGHCRRVTNLSVQLAYQLGLSDEEVTQIHRGALLHDIGKMAIPDSILFKPGPLDEAEWALMRKHPIYAKEMLESIPFLQNAISIPYCHHERWDGLGYPQGLKGEEIPLSSRIFTIVDHWEALGSDRPYRKAIPREQIVVYIQENSGTVFDPRLTDVFLKMVVGPTPTRPTLTSPRKREEYAASPAGVGLHAP